MLSIGGDSASYDGYEPELLQVCSEGGAYVGLVHLAGLSSIADVRSAIEAKRLLSQPFEFLIDEAPVSAAQEEQLPASALYPKAVTRALQSAEDTAPEEFATVRFHLPGGSTCIMKGALSSSIHDLVKEVCERSSLEDAQVVVQDARHFLLPRRPAVLRDFMHLRDASDGQPPAIPLWLRTVGDAASIFAAQSSGAAATESKDGEDDEGDSSVFEDSASSVVEVPETLDQLLRIEEDALRQTFLYYASASIAKPCVEVHLRSFRTLLEDCRIGAQSVQRLRSSPLLPSDIDVMYQAAATWDPSTPNPTPTLNYSQWLRGLRLVACATLDSEAIAEHAPDMERDDDRGEGEHDDGSLALQGTAEEEQRKEAWGDHCARYAQWAQGSTVRDSLLTAQDPQGDTALFVLLKHFLLLSAHRLQPQEWEAERLRLQVPATTAMIARFREPLQKLFRYLLTLKLEGDYATRKKAPRQSSSGDSINESRASFRPQSFVAAHGTSTSFPTPQELLSSAEATGDAPPPHHRTRTWEERKGAAASSEQVGAAAATKEADDGTEEDSEEEYQRWRERQKEEAWHTVQRLCEAKAAAKQKPSTRRVRDHYTSLVHEMQELESSKAELLTQHSRGGHDIGRGRHNTSLTSDASLVLAPLTPQERISFPLFTKALSFLGLQHVNGVSGNNLLSSYFGACAFAGLQPNILASSHAAHTRAMEAEEAESQEPSMNFSQFLEAMGRIALKTTAGSPLSLPELRNRDFYPNIALEAKHNRFTDASRVLLLMQTCSRYYEKRQRNTTTYPSFHLRQEIHSILQSLHRNYVGVMQLCRERGGLSSSYSSILRPTIRHTRAAASLKRVSALSQSSQSSRVGRSSRRETAVPVAQGALGPVPSAQPNRDEEASAETIRSKFGKSYVGFSSLHIDTGRQSSYVRVGPQRQRPSAATRRKPVPSASAAYNPVPKASQEAVAAALAARQTQGSGVAGAPSREDDAGEADYKFFDQFLDADTDDEDGEDEDLRLPPRPPIHVAPLPEGNSTMPAPAAGETSADAVEETKNTEATFPPAVNNTPSGDAAQTKNLPKSSEGKGNESVANLLSSRDTEEAMLIAGEVFRVSLVMPRRGMSQHGSLSSNTMSLKPEAFRVKPGPSHSRKMLVCYNPSSKAVEFERLDGAIETSHATKPSLAIADITRISWKTVAGPKRSGGTRDRILSLSCRQGPIILIRPEEDSPEQQQQVEAWADALVSLRTMLAFPAADEQSYLAPQLAPGRPAVPCAAP